MKTLGKLGSMEYGLLYRGHSRRYILASGLTILAEYISENPQNLRYEEGDSTIYLYSDSSRRFGSYPILRIPVLTKEEREYDMDYMNRDHETATGEGHNFSALSKKEKEEFEKKLRRAIKNQEQGEQRKWKD